MDTEYTYDEISKHNTEIDCWIIVNNIVYDVTKFLDKHPIGKDVIIKRAGADCTNDLKFHSKNAFKILEQYRIGIVNKEYSLYHKILLFFS